MLNPILLISSYSNLAKYVIIMSFSAKPYLRGKGANMKRIVKRLLAVFLSMILLFLIYSLYLTLHLKLYLPDKPITLKELTSAQKKEDFIRLTQYTRDYYPFSAELAAVKGLDEINSLATDYITRAEQSDTNAEFLRLFIEYTDRLRQAGHGGIQFPERYDFYQSYTMDIRKDAYLKSTYWKQMASTLSLYNHADICLEYRNGRYITTNDYNSNSLFIPAGSILKSVDNRNVDDYVLSLQDLIPLRYDEKNKKNFTTQVFLKDPVQKDGWIADFILPDGSVVSTSVRRLPGYQDSGVSKFYPLDNIYLTTLNQTTGYIKINTFEQAFIPSDNEKLQNFMKSNGEQLDKLIIDVRGNTGGELTYWMDLLLRPLLKEAVELKNITAIKKAFLHNSEIRLPMYRLIYNNDLLDSKTHHLLAVRNSVLPALSIKEWQVYEITRKLTPCNTFPFHGEVFIIADNDSLSAADSFVTAVRELKLGTVVGANTYGWGNAFSGPMLFALPNSGLIFRMDIEAAYNTDGRISSIYGTKPDIELATSMYPTTCPKAYDADTLRSDEWILWCINH